MKEATLSSTSNSITYVVYDKKSGKIIHIHESEGYDGTRQLSELKVEEISLQLASKINNLPQSEIATLRVRAEDIEIGVRYEVDVKKRLLIVKDRINLTKERQPKKGEKVTKVKAK
jgi:hypothetical protein